MSRSHEEKSGPVDVSVTGELSSEEYFARAIERTVVESVLTAAGPTRRQLLAGLGSLARRVPVLVYLANTSPRGEGFNARIMSKTRSSYI